MPQSGRNRTRPYNRRALSASNHLNRRFWLLIVIIVIIWMAFVLLPDIGELMPWYVREFFGINY